MIFGKLFSQPHLITILIFLSPFLACNEIVDDHGTPAFVLVGDELVEIHGRILGNYSVYGEIFINEKSKEIYFIEDSEPNAIISLNYETGEAHNIYQNANPDHYITLIDYIPTSNTLYFEVHYYPSRNLIALNPATLKHRVIQTEYVNAAMNAEFVFVNYGDDAMSIKKIDSLGNENILGVLGSIIFASQYTPEILVQSITYDNYFLYNFQSDSITLEKSIYYYFNQLYQRDDEFYYLVDYPQLAIKNFKTDATIFTFSTSISYSADFNPVCWKLAYIEEKEVGKSFDYNQIIYQQLIMADLVTGETSVVASHYNEWITGSKIFNDGKNILYSTYDKIYLSTIE